MVTPGSHSKTAVSGAASTPSRQLITFRVGPQTYAINIIFAREVQGWSGTCRLPGMPECVHGVMNLRGLVIPIIDLRALFDQGMTDPGEEHVVVVLVIGQKRFGILVDDVSDIVTVDDRDLQPLPSGVGFDGQDYLTNILMHGERIMTLLDARRVVDAAGMQ